MDKIKPFKNGIANASKINELVEEINKLIDIVSSQNKIIEYLEEQNGKERQSKTEKRQKIRKPKR